MYVSVPCAYGILGGQLKASDFLRTGVRDDQSIASHYAGAGIETGVLWKSNHGS